MVADELACRLASEFAKPNNAVLDPFCGSGRLLLACAHHPGNYVGIDVNPLAYIIARAKTGTPRRKILEAAVSEAPGWRMKCDIPLIKLKTLRKVEWFSPEVMVELSQIASFINSIECDEDEMFLLAACLSGATRDSSYCRMGGWKLHRLNADDRAKHRTSAWARFIFRLRYAISQLDQKLHHNSSFSFHIGDCRDAQSLLKGEMFDLVITSPPYGDSKSTVEYGAASGLCLDIISNLNGFWGYFKDGCKIDAECLGTGHSDLTIDLKKYWAGDELSKVGKGVARFLRDYYAACAAAAEHLKPGGRFVTVVGCRKATGISLRMDRFTEDTLLSLGFSADSKSERKLSWKKFPRFVNRYGGAGSDDVRSTGVTETMEAEHILSFVR